VSSVWLLTRMIDCSNLHCSLLGGFGMSWSSLERRTAAADRLVSRRYCARWWRVRRAACESCGRVEPFFETLGEWRLCRARPRIARRAATGSRCFFALQVLVGKHQLAPRLAHVPLDVVGEHAQGRCAPARAPPDDGGWDGCANRWFSSSGNAPLDFGEGFVTCAPLS